MREQRPFAEDLGFLLSRASGVIAKSASEALSPLGLRVRSYSVLAFVAEEPEGVTQRRLAALVGLDPSQIVALVDDLEDRDLVTRRPDPADRRNKRITATGGGHRLRDEARRRIDEAQAAHFDRLPPELLHELRKTLHGIAFPDNPA
ncbi:MarR family winged helix-turn-helix transcriptional regulator [Saccharopolyspora sp. NFXS83]|uniref:MarR family winged helix-turn-helix transcriptional regulator n=1 Tax=Saccharopolyspora sp. NFXS83 TaxID=2993560 RepID=UPI00224ACB69|nr:MarR family winged helix-turn-helix transcriptional regulator [Saccharopolyspora sp. NFXS83]MCX2729521.1 MarR family winged helix-turn-helix transcriptional regulator [Saccharopolyspora sp. NFXS83]